MKFNKKIKLFVVCVFSFYLSCDASQKDFFSNDSRIKNSQELLDFSLTELGAESRKLAARHAITYEGGDRFGDRVLVYAQARYLSYLTSATFLYRPFIYTDQVSIEYDAVSYQRNFSNYESIFHISSSETLTEFFRLIRDPLSKKTLFVLEYFPSDIFEWETDSRFNILFNMPWNDFSFRSYLRKTLIPKSSIPDFRKQDMLNVAVHVRTLSGNDTHETSVKSLPLKHPTIDYHCNQIQRVYDWNLKKKMHVFIFTDSKNPREILNQISRNFENYDIEFSIQELEKADVNYAVQDFFAMQKFNVLIATQSNFSKMAAWLSDFDMLILPVHVKGSYPNWKIDRVQVISFASPWFPYTLNSVFKD